MAILPKNTDPSKDYVNQQIIPPLTVDGIVYNKIYAQTGVVDTLSNVQNTGYSDPNLQISNNSNNVITFNPEAQTSWISNTDFGGENSTPVVLQYNLVNTTYYNNLSFDILNVPCFVELLDSNGNNLPGASTFVIAGGTDIYTTTNWLRLEYNAPSTNTGTFTYPLTGSNSISIRITRQNEIQAASPGNLLTNIAYSVGLQNFSIKLIIESTADVPSSVINGTNAIITQNRFGFVENYTYSSNNITNMFVNDSTYWKCAPQPVKDSIVFFYVKISDPSPTTINRLYIDPIYSNCKFNVYYTIDSGTTSSGTVDPSQFYWTPIQRDFTLRKGNYELPTISCTYLKFEFVKLVAEAYDLPLDSVNRTINVFPYDIEQFYSNIEQNIINGNAVKYSYDSGNNLTTRTQTSNQLSSSTILGASTNTIANNNNWPSTASLNDSQLNNTTAQGPTSSSFIIDPSVSYKTIDVNGNYNYQSYTEFLQRRFPDNRIHNYNQISIQQSWHQAYFTGIRYLTAFYEQVYDDLRGLPSNLLASNGTNTGFVQQDTNYVMLQVDETATTPWFPTIDSFKSFNIGGLTTDWQSFLTQGNVLSSDPTLMNNLTSTNLLNMSINSSIAKNGTLGTSTIYSVSGTPGTAYGIKSMPYASGTNLLNYYNANFLPYSGSILNWSAVGSGTTITGTSVTYYNPTIGLSGTASGLRVSGGAYTAAFNFTIPNVNASGVDTWKVQFGAPTFGVVGYGSYSPASGFNYYFLSNVQASGSTTINLKTQFINPTTSAVISGTTVNGSSLAVTSGINIATVTGTNYNQNVPSNIIQLVISGSAAVPYSLYQLGAFSSPTSAWIGPSDHSNMRISGVIRALLPRTNLGTYRASLLATDILGNTTEIVYKVYNSLTLPLNTWFDIQLQGYTATNYVSFVMQLQQVNPAYNEPFYVSMLAPFYHPVRYEFTNTQTNQTWYPITTGVNNPEYFISTASGIAANGIQVRMTALDPNVFISGVSVIPQYDQNTYYANLNIDYIGSSKTNEVSSRRDISSKPYFQLNQNLYPSAFSINRISNITNIYELN